MSKVELSRSFEKEIAEFEDGEKPSEGNDGRPLREVGEERVQATVDAVKKSWSFLGDKVKAGLGWLKNRAVDTAVGITVAPEVAKKGVELGAVVGKYAVKKSKDFISNDVAQTAEDFGAIKDTVMHGVMETGRAVKSGADTVYRGGESLVRSGAQLASEGYRKAGEMKDAAVDYTSTKAAEARDKVIETASAAYKGVTERGNHAYQSAREKISFAKNSFDTWRNDRRARKEEETLKRQQETADLKARQEAASAERRQQALRKRIKQMEGRKDWLNMQIEKLKTQATA